MYIQYVLSICMFALFIAVIFARTVFMQRRGIRVIVLGQTDKSDFLLAPLILAIVYAALAKAFGLPIPGALVDPFWIGRFTSFIGWAGLFICAASLVALILVFISFGDSFRVGIDEYKPNRLITSGLFAYSRNPIYVCFLSFFFGLFLIHRSIAITVTAVIFTVVIHRQILREEKFLESHYGDEYRMYCQRVRRYI